MAETGKMYGWHRIYQAVTGLNPEMDFIPAIPAAITVYVSVFLISQFLYHMTRLFVPYPIREYVLDFVKTMTFCAYPFGHGIVRKNYGEPGYLMAMLPVISITVFMFPEGDGNPVGVWMKYFRRVIPLWKGLLKNIIQIAAGFSAYHLGMYVYRLELHPMYVAQLENYANSSCSSSLQMVAHYGFMLELSGVLYETMFSSFVFVRNPVLDTLVKVLNAGIVVTQGVHLTGMYMHPAMATGHTFGCGDTPRTTHILIYWLAPMIGSWLSVQLQNQWKSSIQKRPTEGKMKQEKRTNGGAKKNGMNANNNNNNNGNLKQRNTGTGKRKFYN